MAQQCAIQVVNSVIASASCNHYNNNTKKSADASLY